MWEIIFRKQKIYYKGKTIQKLHIRHLPAFWPSKLTIREKADHTTYTVTGS